MFTLLPGVYVARTKNMGNGVFTRHAIKKGTIIERSPVIVMTQAERELLDRTLLHDYIFEWGERRKQCCMAMGFVPIYNHSFTSNCEYEMEYEKERITIRAVRSIKEGEELFINYNGTWNDSKPLWFEAE